MKVHKKVGEKSLNSICKWKWNKLWERKHIYMHGQVGLCSPWSEGLYSWTRTTFHNRSKRKGSIKRGHSTLKMNILVSQKAIALTLTLHDCTFQWPLMNWILPMNKMKKWHTCCSSLLKTEFVCCIGLKTTFNRQGSSNFARDNTVNSILKTEKKTEPNNYTHHTSWHKNVINGSRGRGFTDFHMTHRGNKSCY